MSKATRVKTNAFCGRIVGCKYEEMLSFVKLGNVSSFTGLLKRSPYCAWLFFESQ